MLYLVAADPEERAVCGARDKFRKDPRVRGATTVRDRDIGSIVLSLYSQKLDRTDIARSVRYYARRRTCIKVRTKVYTLHAREPLCISYWTGACESGTYVHISPPSSEGTEIRVCINLRRSVGIYLAQMRACVRVCRRKTYDLGATLRACGIVACRSAPETSYRCIQNLSMIRCIGQNNNSEGAPGSPAASCTGQRDSEKGRGRVCVTTDNVFRTDNGERQIFFPEY